WMTCSQQVKVLPWSSSITSWSASPLFTNKRLSIRTPVSLTSRTLHGAERAPRCRRPPRLTSTRAPFRLNPIGSGLLFSTSYARDRTTQKEIAKWSLPTLFTRIRDEIAETPGETGARGREAGNTTPGSSEGGVPPFVGILQGAWPPCKSGQGRLLGRAYEEGRHT